MTVSSSNAIASSIPNALGRPPGSGASQRLRVVLGVMAGLLVPDACHSAPPFATRADAEPRLMPYPSSPAPGEPIDVAFSGFSGSSQDWITVVPREAPTDQHGEWFFTDGQTSGQRSFQGLAPGTYEARAYFAWPSGSHRVEARATIEVGGKPVHGAPSIVTSEAVYSARAGIEVSFSGFSGAEHDWITIAPAGGPHQQYGEWYYTAGERAGRLQFEGLPPGSYELRGYFDWPAGGYAPRARRSFSVVESVSSL